MYDHRFVGGLILALGTAVFLLTSGVNAAALPRVSARDMQAIRDSAGYILRCQLPNGLIAQGPQDKDIFAMPYFANYACIGLLRAYRVTKDAQYLKAVLRYEEWYASHINADGTMYDWKGTRSEPVSTKDYDSSDAYPGTYMALCYETYRITHDAAWLKGKYPTFLSCMDGMKLTRQSDSLTYAKPDYKVKYLMDNLEDRLGLTAGIKIAETLHTPEVSGWKVLLEENGQGLKKLWMPAERRFSEAMFEDGKLDESWSVWYPDGMANAMALDYLLDKRDPKSRELALLVKNKFPNGSDYWQFMALWKFGFTDEARAVSARLGASADNCVDKGHYIRTLVPEEEDFLCDSNCLALPDFRPMAK